MRSFSSDILYKNALKKYNTFMQTSPLHGINQLASCCLKLLTSRLTQIKSWLRSLLNLFYCLIHLINHKRKRNYWEKNSTTQNTLKTFAVKTMYGF